MTGIIRRRRLPSGHRAWQVDYRDSEGHRRHRQFATKDEADNFLVQERQRERQAHPFVSSDQAITLGQYADRWIKAIKGTVAERTRASYAQIFDLYVRPTLGAERLVDLEEAAIGGLLSEWAKRGKSSNTVRLIRAILSAMYADAADPESGEAILTRNPVIGAGGKRKRRARFRQNRIEAPHRRHRVLSDTAAFVRAAAKQPLVYRALFTLMVDQGPRPAEALRLRFRDINWRQGVATIWATKTYKERAVHLTERVLRLLRRLHAEAKREALAAGRPVRELAFVNARGRSIDQSRLTRRMKDVLEKAELEITHGLYDLRHTFVTRGIEAGRLVTEIAAEIGDEVETVMRFYVHPTAPSQAKIRRTSLDEAGQRATHLQHADEKT
jgi:integrase